MVTAIEEVRLIMGLGQVQMLSAIGARPHQKSLLIGKLPPPPAFLQATVTLMSVYVAWRDAVLERCSKAETIGSAELAKVLGINYSHLYMWVRHGYLKPKRRGPDGFEFDRASVEQLFKVNETMLRSHTGVRQQPRRGPLGSIFYDHLNLN